MDVVVDSDGSWLPERKEKELRVCSVSRERRKKMKTGSEGEQMRGNLVVQSFYVQFLVFSQSFPFVFSLQNPNQNPPQCSVFSPFYRHREGYRCKWSANTATAGFPARSRWLVGSQGRELVGGEGSGWQGAFLRCRHALHAFGRDNYNLVP